jgi:hypothetical protein
VPEAKAGYILFQLGQDPALDPVRRGGARVLSFYQRAPIHFLSEAGWGDVDWMSSSLLRWVLLCLCRVRARYWRAQDPMTPPSSGWMGSLFVAAVWLGLVLAVDEAFPILPDALIH